MFSHAMIPALESLVSSADQLKKKKKPTNQFLKARHPTPQKILLFKTKIFPLNKKETTLSFKETKSSHAVFIPA